MRALSVRAPWAGLIASGAKTLEIRSRRTHHRGELLICQSGGGGAVAIVEVIGCRPFVEADDASSGGVWTQRPESHIGHYAWELRLVRRVTSAPIKGRLGFYDVDPGAIRSVDGGVDVASGAAGMLDVRRATGGEVREDVRLRVPVG